MGQAGFGSHTAAGAGCLCSVPVVTSLRPSTHLSPSLSSETWEPCHCAGLWAVAPGSESDAPEDRMTRQCPWKPWGLGQGTAAVGAIHLRCDPESATVRTAAGTCFLGPARSQRGWQSRDHGLSEPVDRPLSPLHVCRVLAPGDRVLCQALPGSGGIWGC